MENQHREVMVDVPRNLLEIKRTALFGLTRRQLLCGIGGLLTGGILFFTLNLFNQMLAVAALVMVVIGFVLLSEYQEDGEPLEVVLKHYMDYQFRRPKKRVYRSENAYAALVRLWNEKNEKSNKEVTGNVQPCVPRKKERGAVPSAQRK